MAYAYGNSLIRRGSECPMFDRLGSQRTVTNSSQTVTATAIYEGFGQTVATTGSTGGSYGFARLWEVLSLRRGGAQRRPAFSQAMTHHRLTSE